MESLIVGLDPGATVGYAILDLNGGLIDVGSFKGSLDQAVKIISNKGKVIIIGTDVMNTPKFIQKFSARINAKVIVPERDLLYIQKKKMTKEYLKEKELKLKNKHEMDALASALFAYKSFKGLFNKIDNEINNEEISNRVKKLVLVEQIPIKKALSKLLLSNLH
ncbi:DUF460 domain-containing protein [Candidatus Woesearchaeota archaeon]|nr:DUF460 domain-containing protein [Candidatus Woesearchaeota archaeon]